MVCAFTFLVLFKPSFQIVGAFGILTAISTKQDVEKTFHTQIYENDISFQYKIEIYLCSLNRRSLSSR
jgi:hypothetical protein